jgi:hypothetical protein
MLIEFGETFVKVTVSVTRDPAIGWSPKSTSSGAALSVAVDVTP